MSWLTTDGGYEVFFNRDELRRRRRAAPPRRQTGADADYLAPADGDHGGAWIAVNAHGVTLALLNRYQDAASPADAGRAPVSRGLLVTALADVRDRETARTRLAAVDLAAYRPFTLLTFDPSGTELAGWDGKSLAAVEGSAPPVVSSSYDPEGVVARRGRLWAETFAGETPTPERLLAFHRSHAPARGPFSPCMHRHDACTVSFCRVRVTPADVAMAYADGSPCRAPLGAALTLPRHEPQQRA